MIQYYSLCGSPSALDTASSCDICSSQNRLSHRNSHWQAPNIDASPALSFNPSATSMAIVRLVVLNSVAHRTPPQNLAAVN
ncbi:hypothetical protein C8Q73DRAFT_163502 [Cubamyces lactineus]|nr:hypothetical protein C8Q73DRAFT_163502 [Cubamyces lactineus]